MLRHYVWLRPPPVLTARESGAAAPGVLVVSERGTGGADEAAIEPGLGALEFNVGRYNRRH